MLVKEYKDEGTKIRIHNDYFKAKDDNLEVRDIIISLVVKKINQTFRNELN